MVVTDRRNTSRCLENSLSCHKESNWEFGQVCVTLVLGRDSSRGGFSELH